MSTLSVTTLNTANGTTDLTVSSGNTSASKIVIPANGVGLLFQSGAGANNLIINTTAATFNGTVADSTAIIRPLVSGTAQATTSGTFVDFTGIPSWARRITIMFAGISTNGTSNILCQIGSGSIDTSGYTSGAAYAQISNQAGAANATNGFLCNISAAATVTLSGHMILTHVGNNIWVASIILSTSSTYHYFGGGVKTLSGVLDRLRLTTANGTDAFDAGSVNIMYE